MTLQIIPIESPVARRQPGFAIKTARSTLQHACGKAILVGEHAVVYGARAVALPLPAQRIQVSLDLATSRNLDRNHLILNGDNVPADVCHVIADAFQLLGLKPCPVYIEGHSNLAMGAGLGSSASLCVVTIRAIAGAYGIALERRDVARLGNELEKRFHGNPSGLDTAVVAYEQVIDFRRGCDPKPITLSPIRISDGETRPWRFALIDSRTRASTRSMIELARPYFTGADSREVLGEFEELVAQAIKGLSHGLVADVAAAMQTANTHLRQAGIVPRSMESIIQKCMNIGCAAAKSTGAGGGGTVIALLDPEAANRQFSELVDAFGHNYVHEVQLPCGG
jgi:mevalonate kinase